MEIFYYGHSFFEVRVKPDVDKVRIAIDPFDKSWGDKSAEVEADLLLESRNCACCNNAAAVKGSYITITEPGEYEIKGVFVDGFSSVIETKNPCNATVNTIFVVRSEGLTLASLGGFGQKELSKEQKEALLGVDILLVPVGKEASLSTKELAQIVKTIEPRLVIPAGAPADGMTENPVAEFFKIFGVEPEISTGKVKITPTDFKEEKTRFVKID